MSYPQDRRSRQIDLAVTNDIGTTEALPYELAAGGELVIIGNITSLTWYAAEKLGGTYKPAYDAANTAVTQTVAQNRSYPIPTALFGAGALKAVGNASGQVLVNLKS